MSKQLKYWSSAFITFIDFRDRKCNRIKNVKYFIGGNNESSLLWHEEWKRESRTIVVSHIIV